MQVELALQMSGFVGVELQPMAGQQSCASSPQALQVLPAHVRPALHCPVLPASGATPPSGRTLQHAWPDAPHVPAFGLFTHTPPTQSCVPLHSFALLQDAPEGTTHRLTVLSNVRPVQQSPRDAPAPPALTQQRVGVVGSHIHGC